MRRPNPQRIHEAKRAGNHSRMVSHWRVQLGIADKVPDAWDQEADGRGLARNDPRYWQEAGKWLSDKPWMSDEE